MVAFFNHHFVDVEVGIKLGNLPNVYCWCVWPQKFMLSPTMVFFSKKKEKLVHSGGPATRENSLGPFSTC